MARLAFAVREPGGCYLRADLLHPHNLLACKEVWFPLRRGTPRLQALSEGGCRSCPPAQTRGSKAIHNPLPEAKMQSKEYPLHYFFNPPVTQVPSLV